MAKGEHITGPDPREDGHLADDAGPSAEPLTSGLSGGVTPLSDSEQQAHLADDLGVPEPERSKRAGEAGEPSGEADWGHALAPPG